MLLLLLATAVMVPGGKRVVGAARRREDVSVGEMQARGSCQVNHGAGRWQGTPRQLSSRRGLHEGDADCTIPREGSDGGSSSKLLSWQAMIAFNFALRS